MSSVRTSVEWLFGDVINYFKFMDFKKKLKIGLSPAGKMYVVCAICKMHTQFCMGTQLKTFFRKNLQI